MLSTLKSKKVIGIALGGIGLLSIIVLIATWPFPSTDGEKLQTFTIMQCVDYPYTTVSITDVKGFMAVKPRTSATPEIIPGTPTPGPEIGIYEFVLRPGSTGEITTIYDFCPSIGKALSNSTKYVNLDSNELRNIFDQTNSTNREMHRFNANAESTYVPPGAPTGVEIYPSDFAKVNENSVKVIYTISATPEADRATYITANFLRVCPGEILTIGNEANEESSQWASGPFYGCQG